MHVGLFLTNYYLSINKYVYLPSSIQCMKTVICMLYFAGFEMRQQLSKRVLSVPFFTARPRGGAQNPTPENMNWNTYQSAVWAREDTDIKLDGSTLAVSQVHFTCAHKTPFLGQLPLATIQPSWKEAR